MNTSSPFFLLYWAVAAFGGAYIAGHSTITLPLRRWLGGTPGDLETPVVPGALGPFGDFLCALIECPACLGFWLGLVCGICLGQGVVGSLGLGVFTSGSNFILGRFTRLI